MEPTTTFVLIVWGGFCAGAAVMLWLEHRSNRRERDQKRLASLDDWGRPVVGLNEPPLRVLVAVTLDVVTEQITVEQIDMSDLDPYPTTTRRGA